MPVGSRRCLTARSTSTPSGPISRSIQGRWSAPTAWWCVSVAAGAQQRVGRRPLGRQPLLDGQVVVAVGQHRHVQRGAGRVAVRDVAHDQRTPSVAGQRLPQRPADGVVDRGQLRPGGRRLQRLDQQAAVHELVAQVGRRRSGGSSTTPRPGGRAGSRRRPRSTEAAAFIRARTSDGRPSQPRTSRQPSPWPRVLRVPRSARAPVPEAMSRLARVSSASESRTMSGSRSCRASRCSAASPAGHERNDQPS